MAINYYIPSKNIKIYPTAYRGTIKLPDEDKEYSFNPESAFNTEENITRVYKALVSYDTTDKGKGDLVLTKNYSYNESSQQNTYVPFEFIIRGYHVRIIDSVSAFDEFISQGTKIYAGIKIISHGAKEVTSSTQTEDDSIVDVNNIYMVNNLMSSIYAENQGTSDSNITNDSQTASNMTNLDILNAQDDLVFNGIILTDTPSDSSIHYFKILEKVTSTENSPDFIVPKSSGLILSLKDICGNPTESAESQVNAFEKIKGTNLEMTSATITSLNATSATITSLNATSATATNLQATTATITTLNSTNANLTNATITSLNAPTATISNLSVTTTTLTNVAVTSNATINLLNVTSATATNLFVSSFTATSGVITSGTNYIKLLPSASTFTVETNQGIKAVHFYGSSDRRLKENIEPLNYEKSILDLPVYRFDFKEGSKNNIGCIAQELQEIYPELVAQDSNGFLSVEDSKLVYLLLEELKKTNAKIKQLEKEISKSQRD